MHTQTVSQGPTLGALVAQVLSAKAAEEAPVGLLTAAILKAFTAPAVKTSKDAWLYAHAYPPLRSKTWESARTTIMALCDSGHLRRTKEGRPAREPGGHLFSGHESHAEYELTDAGRERLRKLCATAGTSKQVRTWQRYLQLILEGRDPVAEALPQHKMRARASMRMLRNKGYLSDGNQVTERGRDLAADVSPALKMVRYFDDRT